MKKEPWQLPNSGLGQALGVALVKEYKRNVEALLKQTVKSLQIQQRIRVGAANTSAKADIWAVGISLYDMVFGIRPFKDAQEVAAYRAMGPMDRASFLRLELLPDDFHGFGELLGDLLHPDPALRPSAAKILQHPVLQMSDAEFAQGRALIRKLAILPAPRARAITEQEVKAKRPPARFFGSSRHFE